MKKFFVTLFVLAIVAGVAVPLTAQTSEVKSRSRVSKEDAQRMEAAIKGGAAIAPLVSSTNALVTESIPGSSGKRVWLSTTESGNWMFQLLSSDNRVQGTFFIGTGSAQPTPQLWFIADTEKMSDGMPFAEQVTQVWAYRSNASGFQLLLVDFSSLNFEMANLADGYSAKTGNYTVTAQLLTPGSLGSSTPTFVLGRTTVPTTTQIVNGVVSLEFAGNGLPGVGITPLTMCVNGQCWTTTYEKRSVGN